MSVLMSVLIPRNTLVPVQRVRLYDYVADDKCRNATRLYDNDGDELAYYARQHRTVGRRSGRGRCAGRADGRRRRSSEEAARRTMAKIAAMVA